MSRASPRITRRIAPRIAAVVIAAGFSKRFGQADKLLAEIDGKPLIAYALAAYRSVPPGQKLAVVQPASAVARHCAAAGFTIIENAHAENDAENGIGTSIAAGMAALTEADYAFIGLADMPCLRRDTVDRLSRAIGSAHSIIIPNYNGQRGHPVLFAARHFPLLAKLEGDKGGKSIIAACPDVLDFAVNDPGVRLDIDTAQDLAAINMATMAARP